MTINKEMAVVGALSDYCIFMTESMSKLWNSNGNPIQQTIGLEMLSPLWLHTLTLHFVKQIALAD